MTEYLTIHREWTNDSYYAKRFSLEELLQLEKTLGMEGDEFSEFITGMTEDDYAEGGCEMLKEMYDDLSYIDEEEYKVENAIIRCMNMEEFQTCYTVFRLWNTHLTQEEAKKEWFSSCYETLSGILED
jgi:hypothetical protein